MFPIQYNNKKEEFYEIIWFHTSLHQKREEAEIATNKTCVIWQLLYVIIDCMQILLLILPFISLTSRVTHMKLMYMKSSDKKVYYLISQILSKYFIAYSFSLFLECFSQETADHEGRKTCIHRSLRALFVYQNEIRILCCMK